MKPAVEWVSRPSRPSDDLPSSRAAMSSGSGFFQHGHTYLGHAVACAAALAVQRVIERDGLLGRVRDRGTRLQGLLADAFAAHPHVGDIRGRGLFWGVELVQDRATKTPFDPARKLHARIKQEAMACGLMVYPMGGTVDGRYGDHVLLAPPFIASPAELALMVERLALAIDRVRPGEVFDAAHFPASFAA